MGMGGWNDVAIVRKYAHFSGVYLQTYAENARRLKNLDTNTTRRKTEMS